MDAQAKAPVIIIKRKKVVAAAGHHGGAWKVAYADFVTAMMAFFMMMWLLNATTETQRKGIADYFSPTIPIMRISGGGGGSFGGDSMFTEDTLAQNGTGASMSKPTSQDAAKGSSGVDRDGKEKAAEEAMLTEMEEALSAKSGESMVSDGVLRHIITRVSDEGLIVELFDTDSEPLFDEVSGEPSDLLMGLLKTISKVFNVVPNGVAVNGYTRSYPVIVADNPTWSLSSSRAHAVRQSLEKIGIPAERLQRVSGFADRIPKTSNTMAARNNRIEVILLRK